MKLRDQPSAESPSRWSTGNCRVEFINEGIDGTHRIVFGDPVVQVLREQHGLISWIIASSCGPK